MDAPVDGTLEFFNLGGKIDAKALSHSERNLSAASVAESTHPRSMPSLRL